MQSERAEKGADLEKTRKPLNGTPNEREAARDTGRRRSVAFIENYDL